MSTWDERRRKSWGYYLCLIIMLWPLFIIPFSLLFSIAYLSLEAILMGVISAMMLISFTLGCGSRYRSRGINPSSRGIVNYGDGHYFERIGADESDYV
ncbi:MAG: hypothetical protein ACFFEV_02425 [Candidatus Thorarchaeota archaeon]